MEADRIQGCGSEANVSDASFWVFPITNLRGRPRSGFSFLPTPDGILLHGGYCKEHVKGSRPVGVMLDDTWFLRYVSAYLDIRHLTKPSTLSACLSTPTLPLLPPAKLPQIPSPLNGNDAKGLQRPTRLRSGLAARWRFGRRRT